MKVTLVYHQFIRRGGLEGYLLEFARRLHDAGHDLRIVTTRIDGEVRAIAGDVHLIPPAYSRTASLRRFAAESAKLASSLKDGPVLGFGRTCVQDIHRAGGGCHLIYSGMLPWWKRWRPRNRIELRLERKLYTGGGTRLFVVNSGMVASEIQRHYGVPAERIQVIRTAVDSTRWKPASPGERELIRTRLQLPADRPVLLFASLDHRRKGLTTLLQSLAEVPGAILLLAGRSATRWRSLMARNGTAVRVLEQGNVDLLPLYQAADWFVHPTRYDACANTVLQSQACGLPGIISGSDGAAELIQEGRNGFVLEDPRDSAALTRLIRTAIATPREAWHQMSAAAREAASALTWEVHMDAWMSAIERISRAAA